MKQQKKLLTLILIFSGLFVMYMGITLYQKQSSSKSSDQEYIVNLKSLTSLSYTNDKDTLHFIKDDGTWYYSKHKDYPIIQSYLKEMASKFQKVDAVRELKGADALKDYGLDKPTYTVKVKDSSGKEVTYYIGNATGDNYYFTCKDQSKIYTVSSDLISNLSYSLDDFIETDTFPSLSTGNLKKVIVTENGKQTVYSGNKENLDGIAGGLGVFTFGDCQNYSATEQDLISYGLDAGSRISVQITYKDTTTKKTDTIALYIGKKDSSKENYYVRLEGSDMVYFSDADVIKNILNP